MFINCVIDLSTKNKIQKQGFIILQKSKIQTVGNRKIQTVGNRKIQTVGNRKRYFFQLFHFRSS